MKRIALLLALAAAPALAQTEKVDSLRASLRTLDGRARLPALQALVLSLESGNPQQALPYAAQGLALAEHFGDRSLQAAFLSSTAYCYSITGDLELALRFADSTLALSTAIGDRDRMAKAHSTLGATYTFMGEYGQALEHHLAALRIREELHLEDASLQSMNAIGTLYHHVGRYDTAIDYYQKMLARMAQRPDTLRRVINAKLNIAFAEYKRGRWREALAESEAVIPTASRANNGTLAYAHFVAGNAATDLRRNADAERYLRLALDEYGTQKHGRVQVLNALGRLHVLTANFGRAVPELQEGASLAAQISARDELKASYELLSRAYDLKGDPVTAYGYYRQFVAARDSIYSSSESDRVAEATMRLATLKKDNEIESLKKEAQISALQLANGRYLSAVLAVVLVSFAAVIAILSWYSRKLRVGTDLLESKNAELAHMNVELNERLSEIRTLSGLLPICAWCKNVRDDQGYWQRLERFIGDRTAAQFSHGICPDCAAKLEAGHEGPG